MSLGVKETKEALVGVNEVALVLVENFKNGLVGEFQAFYEKLTSDPVFKQKVLAAYEGYQLIPDEVKDLDVVEVTELAVTQLSFVPRFVGAL